MTTIEEGVIDIDDNNRHQTDDEATMIVNETLREIQNEQVLSQGKGKEMIETEINT